MVMALPEAARRKPWCEALSAGGQAIHFLPERASTLHYARRLAKIAEAEDAVILHCHFTRYDAAAWLAARASRLRGKKASVVWHAHSELGADGRCG